MIWCFVLKVYMLANLCLLFQYKFIDLLNVGVRILFAIRDFFEDLLKLDVDDTMEKETDENSKKIQEMIEFFDNKKKKDEEEECKRLE